MTAYRLYFADRAGKPAGWKQIGSITDNAVRKSALALMRERSEICCVEVWRESDLAFRLSRLHIATGD